MRTAVVVACFAALLAVGSARAQQPMIIKFSHVVSPDAPKGKAANKFKELAEQYTNGKVKVEVYPNSSLYKDKEELEALQLNSVQLLAPSISKFGPLGVKEFDVFDLPFLMVDDAKAHQMFYSSPMIKEMDKKLEAKGVLPVAYWDNGTRDYTCNRALKMPSDFRGLKLRIQGSKVEEAVVRELGAIPQSLAFSELYQALQTGVVDCEDNTPSNITTQRFYEVQKYMTISNHTRLLYGLVANAKWWNSLPADVKPGIERAVKESTEFFNQVAAKDNEEAIQKVRQWGKTDIHELTPEERKAWIAKLMPIHKEMESRFPKGFIQKIYDASGFTPPTS